MAMDISHDVLMIDLGNSRMSWALYSGGAISNQGSISVTAGLAQAVDTAAWREIPPLSVYIANVAGKQSQQLLSQWFETHWHTTPTILQSQREAYGVTNAYQQVENLGVDRWLGLIGARTMSSQPACVVDCGSAVTIDVMDANGMHQGGLILPGYEMMLASLRRGTEIAVETEHRSGHGLLGRSTPECIDKGCAHAIAASIDQVMQAETGLQLLITGGNAGIISPLLAHRSTPVPDLLFRGIARYVKGGV